MPTTRYYRINPPAGGAGASIVFGPGSLLAAANVAGYASNGSPHLLSDAEKKALGIRWATRNDPAAHQTDTFVSASYNSGTDAIDETWNLATKPVADLQAAKKAAALAVFAAKIAAGRNYGGHNWQLGTDKTGTPAILNLTAMAAKAEASLRDSVANPWPEGFTFRSSANVNVARTAQQMFDLASDVGEYVRALRMRLWAINDAADAAQDKAALDAIDETAGWPSN